MRTQCNGLLIGLLLATAPAIALAHDPAPATAPPPPSMDDPGQPASAAPISANDPRLAPLPAESALATPAAKIKPKGPPKSDGDPTYLPRKPTDDAFHPPPKTADERANANGNGVQVHTESNGDRIEEYRNNGQLTKVRVTPAHGKAFEVHDTNGDGHIDKLDASGNPVAPVQWTLFEWH
jgi:hypothetical protein